MQQVLAVLVFSKENVWPGSMVAPYTMSIGTISSLMATRCLACFGLHSSIQTWLKSTEPSFIAVKLIPEEQNFFLGPTMMVILMSIGVQSGGFALISEIEWKPSISRTFSLLRPAYLPFLPRSLFQFYQYLTGFQRARLGLPLSTGDSWTLIQMIQTSVVSSFLNLRRFCSYYATVPFFEGFWLSTRFSTTFFTGCVEMEMLLLETDLLDISFRLGYLSLTLTTFDFLVSLTLGTGAFFAISFSFYSAFFILAFFSALSALSLAVDFSLATAFGASSSFSLTMSIGSSTGFSSQSASS